MIDSEAIMNPHCIFYINEEPLKLLDNGRLNVNSSPIKKLFCDDDFFEKIANETNLYNTQRSTGGFPAAVKNKKKRRRIS